MNALKLLIQSYKIDKLFLFTVLIDTILNIIETLLLLVLVKVGADLLISNTFMISNLFYVGIFILIRVVKPIISIKLIQYGKRYIMNLEKKLLEKVMNIPYEVLENPTFFELQERAKFSLRNQNCLENLIEAVTKGLEYMVIAVTTVFIMIRISLYLGLILLCLTIIGLYFQITNIKKEEKFYEELAPLNKRIWYYELLPFYKDRMMDIKINKMERFLSDSFKKVSKDACNLLEKFYLRQGKLYFLTNFLIYLSMSIIIVFISKDYFDGNIDIVLFNVTVVGILKFSSAVNSVTESVVDFFRYSKFSEPILKILHFDEEEVINEDKNITDNNKGLIGEKISFTYKEYDVIKNIKFDIATNKVIVIVGNNGAGKSTLVKLITGLYKCRKGSITYKNRSMNNSSFKDVATVFQDLRLINGISLYDNISTGEKDIDIERIDNYINTLNFNIASDFNNKLGKEINDKFLELSGGQYQQVGILRALYRNRDILILDEPTASLDIEKERQLYESIVALKEDKIIFLVTHRLSAVHIADEVWYMEAGNIVASGRHKDIIKKSHSYKTFYDIQADKYNFGNL